MVCDKNSWAVQELINESDRYPDDKPDGVSEIACFRLECFREEKDQGNGNGVKKSDLNSLLVLDHEIEHRPERGHEINDSLNSYEFDL